MRAYDVIVAGTGTAGSATCLELARRGENVLGLDAFAPPHSLGSHHGRSRSLRRAYLEGTSYVPMALAAWELWRKLERDVGATLLRTTGNLTIGRPEDSALSGFLRSARTYDIPHEELTAAEVQRRWPALNLPGTFAAGLEKEAGLLHPELCVNAMLQEASRAGASLCPDEPVIAWAAKGDRVRVTTTRGTHECGRLIITSGARTGKLLGQAGPPLRPKRVVVHWIVPPSGNTFNLGSFPVNFWQLPDGMEMYAMPITEPGGRLKFAAHNMLKDCDPDTVERSVRPTEQDEARRLLSTTIPDLARQDMTSDTCFYTMTPDREFAMGPLPEQPEVLVGAFAGHGFKFAPVLGEMLADMAMGNHPCFDAGIFAPDRFQEMPQHPESF